MRNVIHLQGHAKLSKHQQQHHQQFHEQQQQHAVPVEHRFRQPEPRDITSLDHGYVTGRHELVQPNGHEPYGTSSRLRHSGDSVARSHHASS